ncbi:MAG: helix-turn-helix transcriptional regulator [Alphaproteobacteria bacterium]|nr:helix-turn-helix transcriptional regulator [Alphaproteobacteria bacterium]
MENKEIIWAMKRYNHDNPNMYISTSQLAKITGMNINDLRKKLKKMEKQGLVKSKKAGSRVWSAV